MKKILPLLFLGILMSTIHCTPKTEEDGTGIDNLIWSDEFEGDFIDTTKWKFETGDHGWGNNEWQDYQPQGSDNVEVKDGTLRITARKTGPGQRVGDYTSARINSRESFLYGRIEIRAKMPEYQGPGIWPALWMLGENIGDLGWPLCGEIDLMEYISSNPDSVLMTIHSQANNHMNGTQLSSGFVPLPNIEEEFNIFGLLWEEERLVFYVNGPEQVLLTINRPEEYNQENWPFDKPHYFLMNIAVGGNLGGLDGVDDSIFPATMEIDYVRVYALD
jgi:beta-glucanase (GH16 family)